MYECLYKRILGFTTWWEDQPHMTPELSFAFQTRFGIGGSWLLPVLVC
jgi:hypothetical protein